MVYKQIPTLRGAAAYITPVITIIIIRAMVYGICPKRFKKAEISPIYKKGPEIT